MTEQICPDCNVPAMIWHQYDDKDYTQWRCQNCCFEAEEDEAISKDCPACGSEKSVIALRELGGTGRQYPFRDFCLTCGFWLDVPHMEERREKREKLIAFIHKIDCSFPYDDEDQSRSLIKEGLQLGPDASAMVFHELCRVPRGEKLNQTKRKELFEFWFSVNTPLDVPSVRSLASIYLTESWIGANAGIELMNDIAEAKFSHTIMQVALFAVEGSDAELQKVDDHYQEMTGGYEYG